MATYTTVAPMASRVSSSFSALSLGNATGTWYLAVGLQCHKFYESFLHFREALKKNATLPALTTSWILSFQAVSRCRSCYFEEKIPRDQKLLVCQKQSSPPPPL